MPLPPPKATLPKHWSKKRNKSVFPEQALGLVMSLLLAMLIGACSGDAVQSDPDDEVAQEESTDAPEPEDVEVMDDERSVERRVRDASIAAQVKLALLDASELRPFSFEPVVANGRVLLRGEVRTQDQRSRAAAVAQEVGGVRDVVNEITATEEPEVAESDPSRDSLAAQMEAEAKPETTATRSEAESSPKEESSSAAYHTVRSGENLWTIARSNGVTVDQIKRLNNLSSNNLQPGQRLRVK